MENEERRLLEETAALTKENNALIKKMHRSMVLGRTIKIIYWVIIIGVAVGAFYFVQPYVDQLQDVYGGFRGALQDFQNTTDGVRNFFGSTNAGQ
jgi:hypothetical protein